MAPRERLDREIERLEARLDGAPSARVVDELASVRHGLASGDAREDKLVLPNLRIGFACKQRWDDMVGEGRVRACAGCDRPVFNLSEMTRAEAEAVLATRGLTPCVRFYRRPDGTVMTSDCPAGTAPPTRRRLAVAASSLAAGTVLAAAPAAMADPPAAGSDPWSDAAGSDVATDAGSDVATDAGSDAGSGSAIDPLVRDDISVTMGIPVDDRMEMGIMVIDREDRPAVEWSLWGRLATGLASPSPEQVARRVTVPVEGARPGDGLIGISEAAAGADLTFRVAHDGDLRLGLWGELRTSSDPVAGAELVVEGLPPHPYDSHIHGAGSLVLRAGGNSRVVTGALGIGYTGSYARYDPWIRWARHEVGARVVVSVNRATDEPHDWSATVGLEVEPIGAVHAVYDLVTGR